MAQATTSTIPTFTTVADVLKVTGGVPAERVRLQPVPGTATEADVVRVNESKVGLCELVDGVLVEKTVGHYESYLAMQLGIILGNFVRQQQLGVVHGADGMMRLMPGLIRIPDVSFTTWEQIQRLEVAFKEVAALPLSPDLAVEVLSPNNTKREMDRKLREYFEHGASQVWYLEPRRKEMTIYTAPDEWTVVDRNGVVSGGDVLPGFEFPLAELFVDDERFGAEAQADQS
jgi:Uma2 family endonuclease